MAKLLDKLFNRIIKGKLTIEDTDELSSVLKKAVEQADSDDIYELPDEATQAQLEEAMKHKFIKNESGYVFGLFLINESDRPNIAKCYVNVYGGDDGILVAGIDILNIYYNDELETHYSKEVFSYSFSEILNFDASNVGKVLVIDNTGYVESEDLFTTFTHSLAELDETLRGIIESSITDSEPKPCTQAQWGVIKALLDKSLYFNYRGYSMIKTVTNGIDYYVFGGVGLDHTGVVNVGYSIIFTFENESELLEVEYGEM